MTPASYKSDNSPEFPGNLKWLQYALEHYGVPTVLLLVGCWWFASRIAEPLVKSHVEFLEAQHKTAQQIVETQAQALKNHAVLIDNDKKLVEQEGKQLELLEGMARFCDGAKIDHDKQNTKLESIDAKLPLKGG